MKGYDPRSVLPAWHFDRATNRQLKLLRFFGVDISQPLTKGACSGIIARLFSDPANKQVWAAYLFTTGDEGDASTELAPHDRAALAGVRIPDDWRPHRGADSSSSSRKALEQVVVDILKAGSPFDDPLPDLSVPGTAFCFTGEFEFGTRKECQAAVTNRGGLVTDGVTRRTQVLVVGNDPNPNWSHGSFGNKISDAMILRLQFGKPSIIPELFWRELLKGSDVVP
jgi:NAD-dependent DNA ligase